jgi:hypothetical protein
MSDLNSLPPPIELQRQRCMRIAQMPPHRLVSIANAAVEQTGIGETRRTSTCATWREREMASDVKGTFQARLPGAARRLAGISDRCGRDGSDA